MRARYKRHHLELGLLVAPPQGGFFLHSHQHKEEQPDGTPKILPAKPSKIMQGGKEKKVAVSKVDDKVSGNTSGRVASRKGLIEYVASISACRAGISPCEAWTVNR